jgi:hypothetical protein
MHRPEVRARRGRDPGPWGVLVPGRVDAARDVRPGTSPAPRRAERARAALRAHQRPRRRLRPRPGHGRAQTPPIPGDSGDGDGRSSARDASPSPEIPSFGCVFHRAAARRRRRRCSASETARRRGATAGRRGTRRANRRQLEFASLRSPSDRTARGGTPGRRQTTTREGSASPRETRRGAGRMAKPPRRGIPRPERILARAARAPGTRTHARARVVRRAERVRRRRTTRTRRVGPTGSNRTSHRVDEAERVRLGGYAGSRRVRRRAGRLRPASEKGRDERRRVHRRGEVRGGRSGFAGTGSVRSDDDDGRRSQKRRSRKTRQLRHVRRAVPRTRGRAAERVFVGCSNPGVVDGGGHTTVLAAAVLDTRARGWWFRARKPARARS